MKVGGGIRYVSGPMGSGKSFYAVRRIVDYLRAGRPVISNVYLMPDAFDRIARHYTMRPGPRRDAIRDACERNFHYEESLEQVIRYRVRGTGESRALMVWDEAHNDLNNRTYRDRDQALLEWATQLRKLGFEGILLSQSHENTDAQIRRICNYIVRVQNQRESTRLPLFNVRMRMVPPLFLAWWYMTNVPTGSKQTPIKTERYFLSWHRYLYDTHDLYHGVAELDADRGDLIWVGGGDEGGRDRARSARPADGGDGQGRTVPAVDPSS